MTSSSTGINVARLSHVGLRANDLSKQAEFYTARWGLEPIDEGGQAMFLRADGPDHHVLTLHGGAEAAGRDHFAFEVDHPDDIDRAADTLSALGHEIVTPPTQELEPGVARAIRFKDPREYGGQAARPVQQAILSEEMTRAGADTGPGKAECGGTRAG